MTVKKNHFFKTSKTVLCNTKNKFVAIFCLMCLSFYFLFYSIPNKKIFLILWKGEKKLVFTVFQGWLPFYNEKRKKIIVFNFFDKKKVLFKFTWISFFVPKNLNCCFYPIKKLWSLLLFF